MNRIGEIVTGSDIKSMEAYLQKSAPQTGYVAPTVYRYNAISGINYYSSLAVAIKQWLYLNNVPGYAKQNPSGALMMNTAATQTIGINVDFFYILPTQELVNAPYAWIRTQVTKKNFNCPFRFYKTDGSGPFYAILDNRYFTIAATKVENVSPDKLNAIDNFHREVQLLKYKYNTLASYLKILSKKKLNTTQQQSFNEGMLMLNDMQNQIKQIKGIDITWSSDGKVNGIGVIPIALIFFISLIAAIVGWTAITINNEIQKTKRLNASYDMQKWISEQNIKIQQDPTLTQAQKDALTKENNLAAKEAQKNAKAVAATEPGFLDKIQNLLLIGLGGYLLINLTKK